MGGLRRVAGDTSLTPMSWRGITALNHLRPSRLTPAFRRRSCVSPTGGLGPSRLHWLVVRLCERAMDHPQGRLVHDQRLRLPVRSQRLHVHRFLQRPSGEWVYVIPRVPGGRLGQRRRPWYYMDPDTMVMRTGWLSDRGSWCYLSDSGAMAVGWVQVDGP